MAIGSKTLLNVAMLVTASVGLSGCVYDGGLGYASNYYDDGYSCDPNGSYDAYYDCDYGQGFANTGFGGGWYDNYYYPGYGFYLFDNVGRRYPMREYHRRYWGEKRQGHFREQRSRERDGRRYEGRDRSYSGGVEAGVVGEPERSVRRQGDAGNDRRENRRARRTEQIDQRRSGDLRGIDALVVARPSRVQQDAGPQRNVRAAEASPPTRPERAQPVPQRGRDIGENVRDQ